MFQESNAFTEMVNKKFVKFCKIVDLKLNTGGGHIAGLISPNLPISPKTYANYQCFAEVLSVAISPKVPIFPNSVGV
jgi:hypothetical protein